VNTRNTVVRSMHDVGAAGWFGGSAAGGKWVTGPPRPFDSGLKEA
jgi:hypothetical protein